MNFVTVIVVMPIVVLIVMDAVLVLNAVLVNLVKVLIIFVHFSFFHVDNSGYLISSRARLGCPLSSFRLPGTSSTGPRITEINLATALRPLKVL